MVDKIIEKQSLDDKGIFLFMKTFDESSCEHAIKFILEQNFKSKLAQPKQLTIMINSPGGEVDSAFALIDIIKGSKIPVHTVGLGGIASCGLLLFMSGEKGHRSLTPNTAIMSHQYAWGAWGKEHELMAKHKAFDFTSKRILEHYKKCTGLSEKKILKELLPPSDVWLSPDEAINLGLADKIISTY